MEWIEWIINDIQNLTFRLEDIILHSITGIFVGLTLKVKGILKRIKKIFK